jgi:(R)-2-hydroxyacyl-CoA dehydratese activating ATPase
MRISTGIDLGSRTTKIVQLTGNNISFSKIFPTGHDPLSKVRYILSKIETGPIVTTGYGRLLLEKELGLRRITEIKACARGALYFFPSCRFILDVGGQDCKVIKLGEKGNVVNFDMNDRCAAGTGKFLEVMAHTFNLTIEEFVKLAESASDHVTINSMCTVFAESELVSLICSGRASDEIARGLHVAIAARLSSMVSRFSPDKSIVFAGGGALNKCLVSMLKKSLKLKIEIPEQPQLVAALGVAFIAGGN